MPIDFDAVSLPHIHGQPIGQGRLRAIPEDFQVREELDFTLDGSGEHV